MAEDGFDEIPLGGEIVGSPEVSIVIPTRDRPSWLMAAVRSALAQTGPLVEVVVSDDGSATATAERLRALADPRVRLLRRPSSAGVARARNAGARASTGRWLSFLDDDDLWAPDKLSRQLSAATAQGADAACCGVLAVDDSGAVFATLPPPAPDTVRRDILRSNVVPAPGSNVLVRRDALDATGLFDASYSHLDDWDMWIRLAQLTRFAAVPEPLIGYRYHAGNRSLDAREILLSEFNRLAVKHASLAEEAGVTPDRVGFGRFLGWGARRRGNRRAAAAAYAGVAVRERDPGSAVRGLAALLGGDALRPARFRARTPAPAWARPDGA